MILTTIILLQLTGPGGQMIEVNPSEVVSLREVRVMDHFAPGIKCVINTVDGKFVTVQETCEHVSEMIKEGDNR